ncbi:MAG: class II glutamine amidotransferase [Solimonas sp.]
MCLIIHKPAGAEIPADLLAAAAVHNGEGWGLMGFDEGGRLLIEKRAVVNVDELVDVERAHRGAEYVLHLRRQTKGGSGIDNVHPFKIVDGVYLMHNGTLKLDTRVPGKSDTWHFVADVLRPLAQRHPGLLSDYAFIQVLEHGLRAENKLALLDQRLRRIVLVNRAHGVEVDGLWISNTRWLDRKLFPLAQPLQPQETQYGAQELRFV